MEIIKVNDYNEMSQKAFSFFKEQLKKNPASVLGLATGSTPLGLYGLLIKELKGRQDLSFKTVNLDEYIGLGKDDEQSYYNFMFKNLFSELSLPSANWHVPEGRGRNNLSRFIKLLQDIGQRDIQLLGIGANGHIGFVEPSHKFPEQEAMIINLTQQTIQDNSRFFEDDMTKVPTQAITMGVPQILNAKKIIILASGENKAEAVKKAIQGPVTPQCPASILQEHSNVTWIIDELAGSKL